VEGKVGEEDPSQENWPPMDADGHGYEETGGVPESHRHSHRKATDGSIRVARRAGT